MNQLLHERR